MKGIFILKVGTKNLMIGECFDQAVFNDLARQVMMVQRQDKRVLIVSSGAIQAGRERIRDLVIDSKKLNKKDLAGLGSRHLLNRWGEAFDIYKKEVSQFWLTYANWQNIEELKSIKAGIFNCFDSGLIPIANENDVISDLEIISMENGFSENDRLARMVGSLIGAEGVLFLTDAGGVFEEDPRKNLNAKMYREINPFVFEGKTLSEISELGRGGIKAKIEEAKQCFLSGMRVSIAGAEPDALIKFVRGEEVGTKLGKSFKFK